MNDWLLKKIFLEDKDLYFFSILIALMHSRKQTYMRISTLAITYTYAFTRHRLHK